MELYQLIYWDTSTISHNGINPYLQYELGTQSISGEADLDSLRKQVCEIKSHKYIIRLDW